MSIDNLSAVIHGKNDLRIEQRPIPVANANQLLIRIHTVGICGSDVHYLNHGAMGACPIREPLVLGHEASGIVVEVGKNVQGFSVGEGRPFPRRKFRLKVDFCLGEPRLPEHVSMEEGALLEPLNVAVHACRRAGLKPGQNVLICGAGPIGILNLLTARALGAKSVLLTDIDEKRLALAQDLGADHILNVAGKTPAETAKSVQELFKCQPEVSIECTGVPQSIETAILTTQSGGVVVLVGLGPNRMELPILDAATREVDIRGVFRYSNCYPTALELVANGRINLKSVTKAHYSLKNSLDAFKRAQIGDVIKVFIDCFD